MTGLTGAERSLVVQIVVIGEDLGAGGRLYLIVSARITRSWLVSVSPSEP